jgi:serine phosphatase RsbU (regulator of sigma subunit)
MSLLDIKSALADLRHVSPEAIVEVLTEAAEPIGRDLVLYLVDYDQDVLQPFIDGSAMTVVVEESVASSLAGRAFSTGATVTAERDDAIRVWVPVYEHSARTGVLALTVDTPAEDALPHCESLGMLAGLLVASAQRYTDLVHLRRRGRRMRLAASMQWDLLPPLTLRADRVAVAGMLEPAYEVAGDAFDHAINGDRVDVALFDGMGHGIGSTLMATLAIGTYRHQRRENCSLIEAYEAIDEAVTDQFGGEAFVTGLLARLDMATGALTVANAGHPQPLLLRDRRVIGTVTCDPSVPFGLGGTCSGVTSVQLQPGDSLLLFTDGVVEARDPAGDEFGEARLSDLLEREAAAQRPPEETLRRLVRAVLHHQGGPLRDDATLVLLHWDGPSKDVIPQQGVSAG